MKNSKVFGYGIYFADQRGQVRSKLFVKFPGNNAYFALLSAMHAMAKEPKIVEYLAVAEINKITVAELNITRSHLFGKFEYTGDIAR